MATVTNAHRGFDYATTVPGETVPTKCERSLARSLKGMAAVRTVGWSGTRSSVHVTCETLAPVLLAVAQHYEGEIPDFEVTSDNSHDHGFKVTVKSVR